MTEASPRSILIFSGRHHIMSNDKTVNNCILFVQDCNFKYPTSDIVGFGLSVRISDIRYCLFIAVFSNIRHQMLFVQSCLSEYQTSGIDFQSCLFCSNIRQKLVFVQSCRFAYQTSDIVCPEPSVRI